MFTGLFVMLTLIAIVFVLVEVIGTSLIGVYGVYTIIKNCILYLTNPKFRKACKASDDPKFILKAHNTDEF